MEYYLFNSKDEKCERYLKMFETGLYRTFIYSGKEDEKQILDDFVPSTYSELCDYIEKQRFEGVEWFGTDQYFGVYCVVTREYLGLPYLEAYNRTFTNNSSPSNNSKHRSRGGRMLRAFTVENDEFEKIIDEITGEENGFEFDYIGGADF